MQRLKRHSQRIVVNFDPDAAGANAAERSIDLLLEEGMQVRILELDGGLDPDEYCKERGAAAYQRARSTAPRATSTGWRTARARKYDMRTTEGQVAVLKFLLPAVQRIRRPAGAHADRQRRGGLHRRGPGHGAGQFPEGGGGPQREVAMRAAANSPLRAR